MTVQTEIDNSRIMSPDELFDYGLKCSHVGRCMSRYEYVRSRPRWIALGIAIGVLACLVGEYLSR